MFSRGPDLGHSCHSELVFLFHLKETCSEGKLSHGQWKENEHSALGSQPFC